jgi:galactose mutarotase-like enzyme
MIELKDADSRVTIAEERGAIVTSFSIAGRELLYMDESTLRDPSKNVRGGIPILFPSPGKLDGDRFSHDGKSGSMKQHGFARDEPFRVTGSKLTLESNDRTRARFPWDFRLTIDFVLEKNILHMNIEVTNTGDETMPFGFGIHPYFSIKDKASARITTKATRAFDNVTKKEVPFDGFDLTKKEVDLHLLDHGSSESTLSHAGGAVSIRASQEFSRWVVWTLEGKDFVCLEPWTCPGNALNTNSSLLRLSREESRRLSIEIFAVV